MSFLLKLPAYTIVSHRHQQVLMIGNGVESCPHLFTDRDLVDRYLEDNQLTHAFRSQLIPNRATLTVFLRLALDHSENIVVDAASRDGKPFRGMNLSIDEMLRAAQGERQSMGHTTRH